MTGKTERPKKNLIACFQDEEAFVFLKGGNAGRRFFRIDRKHGVCYPIHNLRYVNNKYYKKLEVGKVNQEAVYMSKKILVTYFSASGETKRTAEELAKAVHGDVYEIQPEIPYTAADLNWTNKQSRSSVEMKDLSFRPSMKKEALDLTGYDEILIGFPIWWNLAPTIINTFMEQYDFSGKTVRVFATSGGNGIENSERSLQKQYPQMGWKAGKLLNQSSAVRQFADMIQ